jgi:molybdopterin molybdotransferase
MKEFVSFKEALALTLSHLPIGESETLPLDRLTGKVLAQDVVSKVDCPSVHSARKDGYAVISADLEKASTQTPVVLESAGRLVAGDPQNRRISKGQAMRVTTGASLPEGADAVVAEEFCHQTGGLISVTHTAKTGRNILKKGTDIRQGEKVAGRGEKLSPALIGLMASAGIDKAVVYRTPQVAVIASGDEVVAPGKPLAAGKLYASNMVELCSWLSMHHFPYTADLVRDHRAQIRSAIVKRLPAADVYLTSGGAWGSERDLILRILQGLNWQGIYHRVRMGPGKPVGFGLLEKKPFFILPGGPPSNEMAFLQLALPALMQMKGETATIFPFVRGQLSETVRGHKKWTDFIHARLERKQDRLIVHPAKLKSRLQSMARKEALIIIPEEKEELLSGEIISVQILANSNRAFSTA